MMPAKLRHALREANATEWQCRAAGILLAINGLESALDYVCGIAVMNATPEPGIAPPKFTPEEIAQRRIGYPEDAVRCAVWAIRQGKRENDAR